MTTTSEASATALGATMAEINTAAEQTAARAAEDAATIARLRTAVRGAYAALCERDRTNDERIDRACDILRAAGATTQGPRE